MTAKNAITGGKPRLTDLPMRPLFEVAKAMMDGADKYGRFNWRPGLGGPAATTHAGAAMGHVATWLEGEDLDLDTGIPHLAKAIGCLLVLLDAQMLGSLVDDRPGVVAGGPPTGWLERLNLEWDKQFKALKAARLPPAKPRVRVKARSAPRPEFLAPGTVCDRKWFEERYGYGCSPWMLAFPVDKSEAPSYGGSSTQPRGSL